MSSNATRFDLFAVDEHGAGKAGGSYTSLSTAERAALVRARQLAERPDCRGHRVIICDGDGTTVATVEVTQLAPVLS